MEDLTINKFLNGADDYLANTVIGNLEDQDLKVGLEFLMDYDEGTTQRFNIKVLAITDLNVAEESYPIVVDAKGHGIIDEFEPHELHRII